MKCSNELLNHGLDNIKQASNNHTTVTKNSEILIFYAKKKQRRGSDKYINHFHIKICVKVKGGVKMT